MPWCGPKRQKTKQKQKKKPKNKQKNPPHTKITLETTERG